MQKSMRSDSGRILSEYSDEPIELTKELGLMSTGYALTELGHMIKLFVLDRTGDPAESILGPNPMVIYDDIRLRVLYLLVLLRVDAVFPAMLGALAEGSSFEDSLHVALERLTARMESDTRLDSVAESKGLFELRERIKKIRTDRKGRNERPVEKSQTVPRLEFAVDLGFLDRERDATGEVPESTYYRTGALENTPLALKGLLERPTDADRWLDREFFKAAGILYDQKLVPCDTSDLRLLYFVKGGGFLKRRVGFIPGRIAATIGCLSRCGQLHHARWRPSWPVRRSCTRQAI